MNEYFKGVEDTIKVIICINKHKNIYTSDIAIKTKVPVRKVAQICHKINESVEQKEDKKKPKEIK